MNNIRRQILTFTLHITLLLFCSGFASGQEAKDSVLFIKFNKNAISSEFIGITDHFIATLAQTFKIEDYEQTMMDYATWAKMNKNEQKEYLESNDYEYVFYPEVEPVANDLSIVINLLNIELNPKLSSESYILSETTTQKDIDWIRNQIDDYRAFIENGEIRKEFIIVKLACKNTDEFETFGFEVSEIESFAIKIATVLKKYAEKTGTNEAAIGLRKKYKYQYAEETKPNFENLVYGEILVKDTETIIVRFKGKLNSNQIRPKLMLEEGLEIYEVNEGANQLAEYIFHKFYTKLNEQ